MTTLDDAFNSIFPTVQDTAVASQNETHVIKTSFLYLLEFLNTSRTGSAQNAAGISFQTFITSLIISMLYCMFQVSIFSLLRCKLKSIYQPNCYYVPDDEKVAPLDDGLFSWLTASFMSPLNDYLKMGLDAYFFLRYLRFLLILFVGLAALNLPVLIPVNYMSGYNKYSEADILSFTNGTVPIVQGLDSISMSNIAPKFSSRLTIHLTMAVISISWFHALVIIELRNYIKTKNEQLSNKTKEDIKSDSYKIRDSANTILLDNVPIELQDKRELDKIFGGICGAKIKHIWFVYRYKELKDLYKKHRSLLKNVEQIETAIIYKKFFELGNASVVDTAKHRKKNLLYSYQKLSNFKLRYWWFLPYWFDLKTFEERLKEDTDDYIQNFLSMQNNKRQLVLRDSSPLNDHKYNKVFIQFEQPLHPYILNQIQISGELNELDRPLIHVNYKDIIWKNLSIQSNFYTFVRVIGANALECIVILGWVIPVAFIGLISQLPYLTALVPPLKWLNLLPEYITDVICNILSVVLLLFLAELAPHVLRWLSVLKGKRTGAEVELDVQKWMFVFSFIHIFLVVTISSGFSVIIESLLNNPVSIPNILANNLPKCSNFFFSYLTIRGFSYFGNNLLQTYQLMMNLIWYPISDFTPRQKFERLSTLPCYKWGSIYSTFSVLGSIGIIYCIISPLILVFCCLSLCLVFISFKYTLKYQYSIKNHSENYGEFYPKAIFYLYSGVYFMEGCLIGMFVLSRNEHGEASCLYHAFLTFILLVITVAGQIQIQKMFGKLLTKNLPVTMNLPIIEKGNCEVDCERQLEAVVDPKEVIEEVGTKSDVRDGVLFNDTFYQKCFQHNRSVVWIPRDSFGISDKEVSVLKNLGIETSNAYCELTNNGEMIITNCPPDYTDD